MTHDFAKKRARSKAPRVASWVWLFTSVVTGFFIIFIYYLVDIAPEADDFTRKLERETSQHTQAKSVTPLTPSRDEVSTPESSPRLTFYRELALLKMVPHEIGEFFPRRSKEEKKQEARKKQETQKKKEAQKKIQASKEKSTAKNQGSLSRYMLQTGSFQSSSDADRRRAELILMGMNTKIHTVTFTNGQTWHRVIVGPFSGKKALHHAQDQLTQLNIAAAIRKID